MSSSSFSVARKSRLGRVAKILLCLAIVGPVLVLLQRHLAEMDKAALADALHAISLQSIGISALFTAISLYAVARYDRIALRQMGLPVSDKDSVSGGFAAVSIGQTTGLGLVVSSAVRWRMYRHAGVTLPQAAMVSGLVIAGFLIGFVVVLAAAVLLAAESLTILTGLSATSLRAIAVVTLIGIAVFALACVFQPRLTVAGRRIPLPGYRVLRAQITLAALDVIPAAIALWVLIPGEAGPTLLALIPVYLVALGIGLISNAPGGLGVLELACLMALPVMPPEHLLAALIAHRAIYYGVPALIAGAMLVARELYGPEQAEAPVQNVDPILAKADRAETMLAFLGDKAFLTTPCQKAMIQFGEAGNSMVILGDPIGPVALHEQMLRVAVAHARKINRAPVFYKASETTVALAVKQGLFAAQIGLDAVLDPRNFSDAGSSFRELRRKVRGAEKAGLSLVPHVPGNVPLTRLTQISDEWAGEKGGERGFSMGYFCPEYLAKQPIIEAQVNGQAVGFLSLMVSGDGSEMTTDVMRLSQNAPDGTMHALVKAGIELAGASHANRFSLAAVPFAGIDEPRNMVERGLQHLFEHRRSLHASHGLMRFKNAFRPEWELRFVVAPTQFDAALGLRDAMALINDVPARADVEPEAEFADAYAPVQYA